MSFDKQTYVIQYRNMTDWISALKSGEYKQVPNKLRTSDGFCCLGVQADLHIKWSGQGSWAPADGYLNFRVNGSSYDTCPPVTVLNEFGTPEASVYYEMNDNNGMSFVQIANSAEYYGLTNIALSCAFGSLSTNINESDVIIRDLEQRIAKLQDELDGYRGIRKDTQAMREEVAEWQRWNDRTQKVHAASIKEPSRITMISKMPDLSSSVLSLINNLRNELANEGSRIERDKPVVEPAPTPEPREDDVPF